VLRKAIILVCFMAVWAPAAVAPPTPLQSQEQDIDPEIRDKMLREQNKQRQQEIKEETEKLFQLATELKAAVDKSNENVLSMDVVRKAEEVEKLAKKVKEKMKEGVGPTPPIGGPERTRPPRPPSPMVQKQP